MNLFTQTIISGLMIGAVYVLLGIGLVLVYRTARVLNLAHGESFAIGGVAAALLVEAQVPLSISILLAVLIATMVALALYRVVLRPREGWPVGTLILITLGAAFLSRGVLMVAAGPDSISLPRLFAGPPMHVLGGALPPQGLALIVIGFLVSFLVAGFLSWTRRGKELLATAENPFAAELLGVNVEGARLIAYSIGGLLGAISAILLVPLISVDFQSGLAMTLRGFIAAAISGMNPIGTIIGGLLLGVFEAFIGTYLGALYQDPVVFCVLILVALWQSRKIRFGGSRRA